MAILFGALLWCVYIVVSAARNATGKPTPPAVALALVVLAILIGEWTLLFMEAADVKG